MASHAIVEQFCRVADGTLAPITQGATLPIVSRRTHAGFIRCGSAFCLDQAHPVSVPVRLDLNVGRSP
jgi:hypothetical protein